MALTECPPISATQGSELNKRQLSLQLGANEPIKALHLNTKHTILIVPVEQLRPVTQALEAIPGSLIVPPEGGLLGTLRIRENIALALRYNQPDSDARERSHIESMAEGMLKACGLNDNDIQAFGNALPLNLSRTERWLAGFVRAVLLRPELLILDRVFSGLTPSEMQRVSQWVPLFTRYFPFRPLLILTTETEGLPALPDCQTIHYAALDSVINSPLAMPAVEG